MKHSVANRRKRHPIVTSDRTLAQLLIFISNANRYSAAAHSECFTAGMRVNEELRQEVSVHVARSRTRAETNSSLSMPGPALSLCGLTHVLVVEDEYLIADDVARAFATIGCFDVGMAADVPAALSSIEQRSPGGVVLDLNLRNEMAFPVADALVRQRIPFVFMTGHEPVSIPRRFHNITRCQKPIAPINVVIALLRVARDQVGAA